MQNVSLPYLCIPAPQYAHNCIYGYVLKLISGVIRSFVSPLQWMSLAVKHIQVLQKWRASMQQNYIGNIRVRFAERKNQHQQNCSGIFGLIPVTNLLNVINVEGCLHEKTSWNSICIICIVNGELRNTGIPSKEIRQEKRQSYGSCFC